MAHIDLRPPEPVVRRFLTPQLLYARYGKRVLDLAVCLALLPVVVPIVALVWALVRRAGAPGFFAHDRVGRNGRMFRCWKIRTMVPDAAERLAAHLAANPEAADEWARTQKLDSDPRVTRLGRFLRRTSLDELPQIWNVLRGEMTLVGPRPVTEAELDRYGPLAQSYLALKPGVTGIWQVHGRANGCYEERLDMDRSYAAQISLLRDVGLILATALVVIRATGR